MTVNPHLEQDRANANIIGKPGNENMAIRGNKRNQTQREKEKHTTTERKEKTNKQKEAGRMAMVLLGNCPCRCSTDAKLETLPGGWR